MITSGLFACGSRAITVLFVDDDADTLFAYEVIATAEGMTVALARGGEEAIALASVLLPDVIVLDLGLCGWDGLDGFEVARRLRASERAREIPIVIVSGYSSPRDLAAVRASGCDGHLVKPCSIDELVGIVTALALRRRAAASSGGGRASTG